MKRSRAQGAFAPQSGRILARLLVAFVFLAAVAAWFYRQQLTGEDQVPVIIYMIDTLRPDRLGAYGHSRPASPNMDALASESVLFEQAYAPAPWTLPSLASLVTSTFACEHGVIRDDQRLSAELKTLAERLRDDGFLTAAYYSNLYAGKISALDRGYETSVMEWPDQEKTTKVAAFLDEAGRQPFLLYLHTMEPHDMGGAPDRFLRGLGHISIDDKVAFGKAYRRFRELSAVDWKARQPLGTNDRSEDIAAAMASMDEVRESISRLYDTSVLWADYNLGQTVDLLKARGIWDRAIFVLISDHGEELGEHGGWLHDQSVYEELLRVPMMIHFPHGEFGGRRISDIVSLVDIMPTLLDYLQRLELCEDCRGRSLLPTLRTKDGSGEQMLRIIGMRRNAKHYYRPWKETRGDLNVAIRQGPMKGIWNEEPQTFELYDLARDPNERRDISDEQPELANSLRDAATAWLEACRVELKMPETGVEISPEAIEQLRSVGYIN